MKPLLILFFLVSKILVFSQADSSKRLPFLKPGAIGFTAGGGMVDSPVLSQAEFLQMAPGNGLGNFDATSYTVTAYPRGALFGAGFSMDLLPKLRAAYSHRFRFKLGLFYQKQSAFETMFRKHDSTYTIKNGTDSVLNAREYKLYYQTRNVLLSFSCIYDVMKRKVFRLYTGVSGGIGCSFNNYVLTQYNYGSENEAVFHDWTRPKFIFDTQEKTRVENSILYSWNVLAGIHLKFHPTSHFSFNSEVKLGGWIDRLPAHPYGNRAFALVSIGFAYRL